MIDKLMYVDEYEAPTGVILVKKFANFAWLNISQLFD